MDIRTLTPDHAVSPQIDPDDLPAIAAAGFTTVICNRPDAEVPPSHQASVMQAEAEKAGLSFVIHPVTHPTINAETVARQRDVIEQSSGPVLAYCASGTRCSILWAFAMAGQLPADEIIGTAARAGYDLSGLRPQLEALAAG